MFFEFYMIWISWVYPFSFSLSDFFLFLRYVAQRLIFCTCAASPLFSPSLYFLFNLCAPFPFPSTFSHNVYLALFTWVSSTNWANCQGSIKHKLEMPRATIAVRLGFRVLGREETQMEGKGGESKGVAEIRWDVLKCLRKHRCTNIHSHINGNTETWLWTKLR